MHKQADIGQGQSVVMQLEIRLGSSLNLII